MKATLEKKRKESEELLNEVAILKKELALAKGNFHAEKIEKYRDIIDKLSAIDWFLMGIALEEAKDYRSAIKFFDKSIELKPNYASYAQRAHAYFCLGLEHSKNKSYSKAIQNYHSAIDDCNIGIKMNSDKSSELPFLFSMRAGIYNFLAEEYEKTGMHQKATKCYEQAVEDSDTSIKLDPSFLSGYYSRGAAYMGLKHFKKSFKDLNKVVHTDSEFMPVAARDLIRGYWKYRAYKYGETLDPNTPYGPSIAYPSGKGEHLFKREGKYNEAIEAFNEAIELDPEDAFSYYYRGRSYIHLKNYRQSFKDFSKAIELNPRNKDAYYYRGVLYFYILNNYEQAMRDCDKCIQLDYHCSYAYCLRGNCYSKLENYKQAIKDYNKAIELDPTEALYYKGRGSAYNALGNNQQVISNFKVAAKLGDKEAQDFLISIGIKW